MHAHKNIFVRAHHWIVDRVLWAHRRQVSRQTGFAREREIDFLLIDLPGLLICRGSK